MPTRTTEEAEQIVLSTRAEHRYGPDSLGSKVGAPARTVSRILRRHDVPYLRECDPTTAATEHEQFEIGCDYAYWLVDDHSRLAYSEILPDETGAASTAFLQRAAAYSASKGIIKPHCPWQNGKAELNLRSGYRVGLPAGVHQQRRPRTRGTAADQSTSPR